MEITECRLCPRLCRVPRAAGRGFCKQGNSLRVARAALHFWEEPCISGTKGTGAVFFSGCSLRCVYCQNEKISHEGFGRDISPEALALVMRRLVEEEGAHSVSLITAAHFVPGILEALQIYRPPLVVYNSSGYESIETLHSLEGFVDVYLPDLKHVSSRQSSLLCGAPDYFEKAAPALLEMARQTGPAQFDEAGLMKKGTLVRHLLLPGSVGEARRALDFIKEEMPEGVYVSLLAQYTPQPACLIPGLSRRVTGQEYALARAYMEALNLPGFTQEAESADSAFTPEFDLTGL